MNLIWGHQHFYKRPTYEPRIFKYADRGFGLRILPIYMKALETGARDLKPQDPTYDRITQIYQRFATLDAYRRPLGVEPGLKTLRRVVNLGRDFVVRWIEYDIEHGQVSPWRDPNRVFKGRTWVPTAERYMLHPEHMDSHNRMPYIQEARFDVGCFKFFMRHYEAWNLDTECAVSSYWHTDRTESIGGYPAAAASNYDKLPAYGWDRRFSTAEYATQLFQSHDYHRKQALLPMLCTNIGI